MNTVNGHVQDQTFAKNSIVIASPGHGTVDTLISQNTSDTTYATNLVLSHRDLLLRFDKQNLFDEIEDLIAIYPQGLTIVLDGIDKLSSIQLTAARDIVQLLIQLHPRAQVHFVWYVMATLHHAGGARDLNTIYEIVAPLLNA